MASLVHVLIDTNKMGYYRYVCTAQARPPKAGGGSDTSDGGREGERARDREEEESSLLTLTR